MFYDLPRSRCVEKLLLHQLRLCLSERPCLFFANCSFIKSVYCLVKAIKFYIQQQQQLDLIKLQLAENKHGLFRQTKSQLMQ